MVPKMMKAVQIQEYNQPYHVSEVPVPHPKPHQVLVRIKAAGFCHTDLMALNGEFKTKLPFIGSHEPAGIIEELGSNVKDFQRGDRVGCINFDSVCGECPDCHSGLPIYCDKPLMKGITIDGAWADYMVAYDRPSRSRSLCDARFIVKLPDDMEFKVAAPLMCAGISIYGGIQRAKIPIGGSIGIIGIGGLGHIGTQIAKCMGYTVAAVDVKQQALDAVASYEHSPDALILATDTVEESLQKIDQVVSSEYRGLDATVLATDHPSAFELAAALTRKHGTMVLLGQPEKGITMSYHTIIYKNISLVGSLVADTASAQELVSLFHKNRLHVEVKEWNLNDAENMRQSYLSGKGMGKNVVIF